MAEKTKNVPRSRKLSEVIAAQLMQQIRESGWPVGESLGTEAELIARFKVSRATIVEAVRQIEEYGAAVMRRGSGGGLVVTNSARTALARAISTYLELATVTIFEQYEATLFLETESVKLAVQNASDEQVAELRLLAAKVVPGEDNIGFHRSAMKLRLAIADACGTYPVLMIMQSLVRVLTNYVRPDLRALHGDREFQYEMAADLSGMVEAIVGGDGALGAHFVRKDVERREKRARELAVSHPLLQSGPLRHETPNKLAEQVAFSIREDIARMGWRVGERLGDEADLPARYNVSPWVLRQAIRILEPLGIVAVRRGQGGGIYVNKPSPDHTIEMAVSYMKAYRDSTGVSLDGYLKIRRVIFQWIAQFAAARSTLEERECLLALATSDPSETQEPTQPDEFWKLISAMGRNQILELFGAILNGFITASDDGELDRPNEPRVAIAKAIFDGDAALARRRMGTYL